MDLMSMSLQCLTPPTSFMWRLYVFHTETQPYLQICNKRLVCLDKLTKIRAVFMKLPTPGFNQELIYFLYSATEHNCSTLSLCALKLRQPSCGQWSNSRRHRTISHFRVKSANKFFFLKGFWNFILDKTEKLYRSNRTWLGQSSFQSPSSEGSRDHELLSV